MSQRTILLLGTLVAAACGLGARSIARLSQLSHIHPTTILTHEEQLDQNGQVKRARNKLIATRRDGTFVEIDTMPWTGPASAVPSGVFDQHMLTDLQSKTFVSFYPALKMKTTVPLPDSTINSILNSEAATECPPKEGRITDPSLDKVIVGHKAQYEEARYPDGEIVKRWRAPDLGCRILESQVSAKEPGTGSGRSTTLSIISGDPPADLFRVPDGLVESTPSQVLLALEKLEGRECPDCMKNTGKRADEHYLRSRQAEGWK